MIVVLFINSVRLLCQGIPDTETIPSIGKKIKILRIIARLNIGGPAIHVQLLTKGLDRERFESTLVTGSLSPEEGDMSYLFDPAEKQPIVIPELQREIRPFHDVKVISRIWRILNEEKPDIVHTHTAKAGTVGRLAALLYNLFSRKKIKLVHTFHGHVFEGYFGRVKSKVFIWIERFLASRTDRIIAISETQKKELSGKYQIAPASKIHVIPLGFDLTPFLSNKTSRGEFRKDISIGENTILIGIVGRLVPIKNHHMFLESAKILLENSPDLKVKFAIIGDGELRKELENYCMELGLHDHVIFCGWIKDLVPVYADLDILALTSDNEGTPVSIIEAMASSVPVIATDVGGVRDLLETGKDENVINGFLKCEMGILCRKGDSLAFANGLRCLLEANKEEKRNQIIRARSFAREKYSERRLLRDIENH
ncbi:MAG: glycosyltransferase, partial [Pseudomonadota bacterium]